MPSRPRTALNTGSVARLVATTSVCLVPPVDADRGERSSFGWRVRGSAEATPSPCRAPRRPPRACRWPTIAARVPSRDSRSSRDRAEVGQRGRVDLDRVQVRRRCGRRGRRCRPRRSTPRWRVLVVDVDTRQVGLRHRRRVAARPRCSCVAAGADAQPEPAAGTASTTASWPPSIDCAALMHLVLAVAGGPVDRLAVAAACAAGRRRDQAGLVGVRLGRRVVAARSPRPPVAVAGDQVLPVALDAQAAGRHGLQRQHDLRGDLLALLLAVLSPSGIRSTTSVPSGSGTDVGPRAPIALERRPTDCRMVSDGPDSSTEMTLAGSPSPGWAATYRRSGTVMRRSGSKK